MLIRVDREGPLSLAEQIVLQIKDALRSGDISRGDRLPTARDLASAVDVNMHTVLRAYAVLQSEHLIEMRRGRGAVVIGSMSERPARLDARIHELLAEAAAAGISRSELVTMIRGMK